MSQMMAFTVFGIWSRFGAVTVMPTLAMSFPKIPSGLAIYRMVFGQSRQEDLIAYLLAKLPDAQQTKIVAELQIDLSPANLDQPEPSVKDIVSFPKISSGLDSHCKAESSHH